MKRYEAPEMIRIEFQTESILNASDYLIDFDDKENDSKVEIGVLPIDLF